MHVVRFHTSLSILKSGKFWQYLALSLLHLPKIHLSRENTTEKWQKNKDILTISSDKKSICTVEIWIKDNLKLCTGSKMKKSFVSLRLFSKKTGLLELGIFKGYGKWHIEGGDVWWYRRGSYVGGYLSAIPPGIILEMYIGEFCSFPPITLKPRPSSVLGSSTTLEYNRNLLLCSKPIKNLTISIDFIF